VRCGLAGEIWVVELYSWLGECTKIHSHMRCLALELPSMPAPSAGESRGWELACCVVQCFALPGRERMKCMPFCMQVCLLVGVPGVSGVCVGDAGSATHALFSPSAAMTP